MALVMKPSRFLAIALATILCGDAQAYRFGKSDFNGGGVHINRGFNGYFSGMNRWINIWQQGDPIVVNSSLNGAVQGAAAWNALGASGQTYFDSATGELNAPVQTDVTSYGRGLFTKPGTVPNAKNGPSGDWWLGAVYNLEWDGSLSTATTKIFPTGSYGSGGSPGLGTIGGCGTNCVTVTFGNSAASPVANLALYFTIDASNRSDPPRNIRFYPAQFQSQARSSDLATRLINPDWLAQWGAAGKAGIGKIRWMVELGEINQNGMTDYSQLAESTFNTFAANALFCNPGYCGGSNWTVPPNTNLVYGPKGSVGPKTVCLVQNKVKAHAHYLFPWGANSTFGTQVAQEFDSCMGPNLVVDYEYCNEIWNTGGAAFKCYFYMNQQPWPPLGPSAPYQQALTITSITVGASTTTINVDSNPYTNGQSVSFQINPADSIASVLNGLVFSVGNASPTSFTVSANTSGKSYSSGGTAYKSGSAILRGGYNAAVLMNQVYNAYGPAKRARWRGILGSQLGNTAITTDALTGAMFYVTNESTGAGPCAPNLCLQDLFDYVEVATYSANPAYNGIAIQNITQNTAAGSTAVAAANHTFTNGQKIRIYANTGMTQIDNATATVSNVGAGTFNIDIDTTGYSAWVSHTQSSSVGNGNFAIDNTLPKAIDDSIALNASSPATYPTKYSYFAEQMTDAILNGSSVSNPSFGYSVTDTFNFRSLADCGVSCIPGRLLSHARLAKAYGLTLNEYEGASFGTYLDTNCTGGCRNITSGGAGSNQLWDFMYNWQYDAGTALHGPADIVHAHVAAARAAGVGWPSIYNEEGQTAGPFYFTRYFGDVHPQVSAFYGYNAQGPYVEPKPARTWAATYAGNATNRFFSSSGCASCTDTLSGLELGTSSARVFVLVTSTGTTGTPTVTCDTQVGGNPVVLTQDVTSVAAGGIASIYSGQLSANASSARTCTAQYSGSGASGKFREYYAFVVTGLQSGSPTFTGSLSSSGGNITANSDSLVVVSANRPSYDIQIDGYNTPSPSNPATTTEFLDYDGTTHAAGMGVFGPKWGSQLMNVRSSNGGAGNNAVAVYH